jgi:hypothetical protein
MAYAERNRAIKKLLESAFGRGKIRVKGHRGTASSWVSVYIGHAPRNQRETQELLALVKSLIAKAKIEIDTYGYDDPGSDYGYGSTISVNFEACLEKADPWGEDAWRHHLSANDWDSLQQRV